jgi:hypothetical protein
MGKLTVHKVKALKRPGVYGDGNNLVLAIRKSGAKFWPFKYARDGREHSLGLGPVHTVDLHDACDAAHAFRKALREGRDPIAEKRTTRLKTVGARTFAAVARDFHETQSGRWRNEKYRKQWLMGPQVRVQILGEKLLAFRDTEVTFKLRAANDAGQKKMVPVGALGHLSFGMRNCYSREIVRCGH